MPEDALSSVVGSIKKFICVRTGMNPAAHSEDSWTHLISAEMRVIDCDNLSQFYGRLKVDEELAHRLIARVLVHETWFYRDRQPYEFLLEWARKTTGILRILSVACATGEEPYSIAMALLDGGIPESRISVEALDISASAVAFAKAGVYRERAFRGVDEPWRHIYFSKIDKADGGEGFYVSDRIRRLVHFHVGNAMELTKIVGKGPYSAVFCRNVFIYLSEEAQNKILKEIDHVMVPRGVLVVGAGEGFIPLRIHFKRVEFPRSFAYQKPGA